MSTITVEKLRLTGALQVPVLTQAQINALSPEQGQIVYNSDINYIQIYGPFNNWGLTDIGTGNDLWDIENQTNNGSNSMKFLSLGSRGDKEGPNGAIMSSTYQNSAGAWAGNARFLYMDGFQGYQTVAIPKALPASPFCAKGYPSKQVAAAAGVPGVLINTAVIAPP